MGLVSSPNVVRDSLIVNLDASSIRSFQGVARTNLARGVNFSSNNVNGTYYKYTQGTEVVDIPQVGKRTVKYVDHWNDYPGSGACCPNIFYYHDGWVSVSGSTTYTYSLIYKTTTGYTHPNFMYRYEYVNSSTYVTEGGVHNDSNRIHLGEGWYYAWGQFTTQPTTNTLVLYLFYYQYATWDRIYVDRASLVVGSTVPDVKHITAYNSTNSGNWTDTIGGYTGTLTNGPTYDSGNGGSIVFDGTNDYISIANNTALDTQTPSVEVWVKTDATSQNGFWFEKGAVNTQYALFQEGSNIVWRHTTNVASLTASGPTHLSTAAWAQVVGTYTSGDRRIYVNGVQVASDSLAYTIPTNSSGIRIGSYLDGGYFYDGKIAIVRVYTKNLSSTEVLRNFEATRARFGV